MKMYQGEENRCVPFPLVCCQKPFYASSSLATLATLSASGK